MAIMNVDQHSNLIAQEGIDRCFCGSKYWEQDNCVSCGTPITSRLQEIDPVIAMAATDNRIAAALYLNILVATTEVQLGLATYAPSTDIPTRKLRNKR